MKVYPILQGDSTGIYIFVSTQEHYIISGQSEQHLDEVRSSPVMATVLLTTSLISEQGYTSYEEDSAGGGFLYNEQEWTIEGNFRFLHCSVWIR